MPNLYEMLVPARERTKKFYVGSDFDPVKVGVDTSGNSGRFLLDTTLLGNSNASHSFEDGPRGNGVIGPLLTDKERWSLVDYLKSIPEEPGGSRRSAGLRKRRVVPLNRHRVRNRRHGSRCDSKASGEREPHDQHASRRDWGSRVFSTRTRLHLRTMLRR